MINRKIKQSISIMKMKAYFEHVDEESKIQFHH